MCRKQKLIQDFGTTAMEKADLQKSSFSGCYVPKGDPGNLIVSDNLRPRTDPQDLL